MANVFAVLARRSPSGSMSGFFYMFWTLRVHESLCIARRCKLGGLRSDCGSGAHSLSCLRHELEFALSYLYSTRSSAMIL